MERKCYICGQSHQIDDLHAVRGVQCVCKHCMAEIRGDEARPVGWASTRPTAPGHFLIRDKDKPDDQHMCSVYRDGELWAHTLEWGSYKLLSHVDGVEWLRLVPETATAPIVRYEIREIADDDGDRATVLIRVQSDGKEHEVWYERDYCDCPEDMFLGRALRRFVDELNALAAMVNAANARLEAVPACPAS